jgi:prepilin-type N-terminal cleavage/methylation domain-containing protein
MFARIRTAMDDREQGFTLIELLVVMIIIGILAAIAIPTFLNQRKNGYNSATKTDLGNIGLAFESAAVDKGGDFTKIFVSGKGLATNVLATNGVLTASTYPASTVEFSGTQNVTLTLAADATATQFCVYGENQSNTGTFWVYTKGKGGLQPSSYTSAADAKLAC